jgi:electron transfer flavoprotein beta subunit
MKILVCMSNVPDTTTKVRFTENNTSLDTSGIQWVINPWDELALTRAIELKEAGAVSRVDVINVGPSLTEATLRKALAVGADGAFRIDAQPGDGFEVATLLAGWIKENPYDIILSGIESSDYNSAAVGVMTAELAGMASVSSVTRLEIENGQLILQREIEGGQQKLKVNAPVLAVVQKGIAKEPRIPAMRGIMMARQKPLQVLPATSAEARSKTLQYKLPEPKGSCKMLDPEQAELLFKLLHEEAKVL